MFDLQYEPSELLHRAVDPFDFEKEDAEKIEAEMIKVMLQHDGIGLASNQVGFNHKVFVIGSHNIKGFIKPRAFFNARLIRVSIEEKIDREGCLSYPGLWLNVKRPVWIEATYQNSKGEWEDSRIDGYLAKCFQHEFDHTQGICFINRVGRLKLELALKKMSKNRGK
jgi:peptide deformylase